MGSAPASDDAHLDPGVRTAVAPLVVGHFAVGRTTFVRRDARDRASSTQAPIALAEYLMTRGGEREHA
ncbi:MULTISPECIES: hypothetical protein [unclassified Streptomyces]|uniref:hypothetical protein n=1 Tax=unclassified Streptomyces TaxID=2593676 RepID=UPI00386AD761